RPGPASASGGRPGRGRGAALRALSPRRRARVDAAPRRARRGLPARSDPRGTHGQGSERRGPVGARPAGAPRRRRGPARARARGTRGAGMNAAPIEHALLLAVILFALGMIGVLVRRNLVFMLIAIEIMLNATALAFVAAGARWAQPDGQVMFILVLTLAAAEVSVALALLMQVFRVFKTLDADALSEL